MSVRSSEFGELFSVGAEPQRILALRDDGGLPPGERERERERERETKNR